ncbi:In chloroplast atpase biogenesis protein, partial [Thalictrum thalictroides]
MKAMKIGTSGGSSPTALPKLLLRRARRANSIRCSSSTSTISFDHVSFIKDIAATQPPQHLQCLLKILQAKDGSLTQQGGGYGGILRDSDGAALYAFTRQSRGTTILCIELEAIYKGVQLAKELGIKNILVCADSKQAIDCINGYGPLQWRSRHLVAEIHAAKLGFEQVTFRHFFRETNRAADLLAALGESETIISPGARKGLIPLAVPLTENESGAVTALLRWPTAPPGMEMPVVEVRKHGVWLLAKNVDQYIHRILVEEDANNIHGSSGQLYDASSEAGRKLYLKGDFAESRIANLDVYLLKKVGLFPDILERKVKQHFEKGDHKDHFPGFGRPFVFNAEVLLKVGRESEAKDAARGALKSPWWTLGCTYQ